jgi:hypothetical protein
LALIRVFVDVAFTIDVLDVINKNPFASAANLSKLVRVLRLNVLAAPATVLPASL